MRKSAIPTFIIVLFSFCLNAQNSHMYIMKQGNVLGVHKVSEIDSIIYYKPSSANILTDADGNEYNTIVIGKQIWMAENLKTTKYNDGTAILHITNNSDWFGLSSGYCWYNNDPVTYKNIYGALYNWVAVDTGKLCPLGWHVPSDADWITLANYLGGEVIAGGKLKEPGTMHWNSPNTGATNESNFTALPGGYRNYNGVFFSIKGSGAWWSSTEYDFNRAWYRHLRHHGTNLGRLYVSKQNGFSVRCIRYKVQTDDNQ